MAHLTQYSNSVPVIKFNIEQTVMTIGQNFEMDICVPEDSMADNHAKVQAIKEGGSYRFIAQTAENQSQIELNGESVADAELKDGDWLTIGGVEFQFTDDGINEIKNDTASDSADVIKITPKAAAVTKVETESVELKEESKAAMSTKEFLRSSRMGRRITAT